jgi:hypothetical protein
MPEYILDFGDHDAAARFDALDLFEQSYIEAAFFADDPGRTERASRDGGDDGEECTLADLSDEAWARFAGDCARFRECAGSLLDSVDEAQAGHDFWLTRNGHGAGFWSRPDDCYGDAATRDKLNAIACGFRECDLYLGDDGKIYAL